MFSGRCPSAMFRWATKRTDGADSTPAGGEAPRPGRRILSVLAMFLGALVGAQLVLHGHLVFTLVLTLALLAVTSVTSHRLSTTDAAWVRPRP
jgi:hypothetical protein